MIYFLLCFLILLSGGLGYLLIRSLRFNRNYEIFFNESIEDLHLIIEGIDAILIRKPLMSEDPDVRTLIRGIRLASELLNSYAKQKSTIASK